MVLSSWTTLEMKQKETQALEKLPLWYRLFLCPSFVWHPTNLFHQNHSFFFHKWISGKCKWKEVALLGNGLVAGDLVAWCCTMIKVGCGHRICNPCMKCTEQLAGHLDVCLQMSIKSAALKQKLACHQGKLYCFYMYVPRAQVKVKEQSCHSEKHCVLIWNRKVSITTSLSNCTSSTKQADL